MTENYEQDQDGFAEASRVNKNAVFDALAAAGITEITVAFDGWGDSGQVGGIIAKAGSKITTLPTSAVGIYDESHDGEERLVSTEKILPEAVEALCYGYLEEHHGGWEIDDGSFGDFTFDVAARTIHLEYNGRISDVFTECEEF